MGRLEVAKTGGSSPSSAESSFRELDEVFLQSQTRIWLGEVLNTRLDEDLHISDLLQDGEILFEVSKAVWDLLLKKCMELRHLKHRYGPFGSKKSSGRYRPYSNVDSFLKVCKILGLSGIDLFSPSDVVEKRDIRKVCICVRALSKKARSKQLKVPDFDLVMYSVSMPTDMVGGIRKSLESSQYTFSSSSSYSSQKASLLKLKQEKMYATSDREDESSSDESDEAESRYMGENSFSSTDKFDAAADRVNSEQEDSPEVHSTLEHYKKMDVLESDVKCQGNDTNFVLEDDSIFGDSSSIILGDRNYISDYLDFSDLMVHATDGSRPAILDGENNMFDFFLNVDSRGIASKEMSSQNVSQRKYSDDEDMEVSSTTSMSSVLCRMLNLEFDDQFDTYESSNTNVYSSGSMEIEGENKDHFILSESKRTGTLRTTSSVAVFDSEDAKFEMAPRTPNGVCTKKICPSQNKCQISGHPRNSENDYCREYSEEDFVTRNREIPFSEDKDNETVSSTLLSSDSDPLPSEDSHISADSGSNISDVTSNYVNSLCHRGSVEVRERTHTEHHFITAGCVDNSQDTTLVASDDTNHHNSSVQENNSKTISITNEDTGFTREDDHVSNCSHDSSDAENGSQDKLQHNPDTLAETNAYGRKGTDSAIPTEKRGRMPLLKTVVKGTAIAGVLFLVLHIRKTTGNNAQETKQGNKFTECKETKVLSTKQQTGSRGKGMYPSEKIKL